MSEKTIQQKVDSIWDFLKTKRFERMVVSVNRAFTNGYKTNSVYWIKKRVNNGSRK